jgi:hypothetical protein
MLFNPTVFMKEIRLSEGVQ